MLQLGFKLKQGKWWNEFLVIDFQLFRFFNNFPKKIWSYFLLLIFQHMFYSCWF